ncbi:unnamed protein product [Caenorhabditis bovis]|uniref:Uncharacterized protein n=1 Tax=Caenorhabditis bovis TaxID=2654633 RepID=A0A8S1F759_9PELO|nr:unnamed protein product [Caenorhabditis bovis]
MKPPHLCDQPMNLTKRACCQLILFLNDTERKPPVYLVEPIEEHEDHFTFFFGIFLLMLIALTCTFGLSKITKPKVSVGYNNSSSSYDVLMWLSSNPARRTSMLVLLRSIACRNPATSQENTSVSVVSSNVPLLPSYQRATTAARADTAASPPPPYSPSRIA